MVLALLLLFRMPLREVAFVSWVGLRGAVPIMLGTFPVLAGLPYAQRVFDLVFFVVVVSAVCSTSIGWAARKLGLEVQATPSPRGAGDQLDPGSRAR